MSLKANSGEALARKVAFLRIQGAATLEHTGSCLLEHLLGTHSLLTNWGARRPVCDAGLFHSIYGTDPYHSPIVPLDQRATVRALIGAEAERLVFLFAIKSQGSIEHCLKVSGGTINSRRKHLFLQDRRSHEPLAVTARQLNDLTHLEVANVMDQLPRLPKSLYPRAFAVLRQLHEILLPAAQRDIVGVLDIQTAIFEPT